LKRSTMAEIITEHSERIFAGDHVELGRRRGDQNS
jgi:hypothetical protein